MCALIPGKVIITAPQKKWLENLELNRVYTPIFPFASFALKAKPMIADFWM
jgi:hypothetical protein